MTIIQLVANFENAQHRQFIYELPYPLLFRRFELKELGRFLQHPFWLVFRKTWLEQCFLLSEKLAPLIKKNKRNCANIIIFCAKSSIVEVKKRWGKNQLEKYAFKAKTCSLEKYFILDKKKYISRQNGNIFSTGVLCDSFLRPRKKFLWRTKNQSY